MNNVNKLKTKMNTKLDELKTLSMKLKNDGDTCECSQRICLLEAMSKVERYINGIESTDL